jgi:predicted Zn-dependent protease
MAAMKHAILTLAAVVLLLPAAALADSAQERYDKAAELIKAKKLPEAKKELEKAVELDPKHVDAQSVLAQLLKREGKPEAAARHLEKAIEVKPDDAKLRGELANCWFDAAVQADREKVTSTKKRDELAAKAIDAYNKGHELDPTWVVGLYIGTLQALTEKWKEAAATLEAYVKERPDDLQGLFNYAQACDKADAGKDRTIAAWEGYVAKAKDDARAKKDVAFAEGRIKALRAKK